MNAKGRRKEKKKLMQIEAGARPKSIDIRIKAGKAPPTGDRRMIPAGFFQHCRSFD